MTPFQSGNNTSSTSQHDQLSKSINTSSGFGLHASEVTQAVVNPDSPVDVATTILTIFVLSPLIICSNWLLLVAFRRYKRLQTPSNCLIASLAVADTGVGLILPLEVYFELTKNGVQSDVTCLLPYCILIAICGVSILSMATIALDRYTSLSAPLRYNNIITKTSVVRYVATCWTYSVLVSLTPILERFHLNENRAACSFDMVTGRVRVFIVCTLFVPCAATIVFCYAYVYIVARSHANAIYSVELSVRRNGSVRQVGGKSGGQAGGSHQRRYGWTLALTVGLFLALWTPLQLGMVLDAVTDTVHLQRWTFVYLALVAFVNSALNPWVYGYRNTEFRLAYQRILEDIFAKCGMARKQDWNRTYDKLALPSCASNMRLCVSPNHLTMTSLLKATPEPTTIVGDSHSMVIWETINIKS